jgi:DNA uptake protein ComE-like DNA-binding protein
LSNPSLLIFLSFRVEQAQNGGMIRSIWIGLLSGSIAIAALAGQNQKTTSTTLGEPIDINRASAAELLAVPGMTASWAGRIVRFRPYRTKLDLVQLGVLSPEVYQRIRENVIAHRINGGEQSTRR